MSKTNWTEVEDAFHLDTIRLSRFGFVRDGEKTWHAMGPTSIGIWYDHVRAPERSWVLFFSNERPRYYKTLEGLITGCQKLVRS